MHTSGLHSFRRSSLRSVVSVLWYHEPRCYRRPHMGRHILALRTRQQEDDFSTTTDRSSGCGRPGSSQNGSMSSYIAHGQLAQCEAMARASSRMRQTADVVPSQPKANQPRQYRRSICASKRPLLNYNAQLRVGRQGDGDEASVMYAL